MQSFSKYLLRAYYVMEKSVVDLSDVIHDFIELSV